MKNSARKDPFEHSPKKGVSWRAIFAGTICVLALMLLLNLFGLASGLGSINPVEETNPLNGIGTGSIIWWILSNLIALFAGGYVAARVGVSFNDKSGAIQGIMTWALYTLISAWLLTSVVGSLLSGVGSVVSGVISTAGTAINNITPEIEKQNMDLDLSLEQARREFYQLLDDANTPELDPEAVQENTRQVVNEAKDNLEDALADPENIRAEIDRIFNDAKNQLEGTFEAVDREALVNILSERMNISESEAESTVDKYLEQYENLRQEVNTFLEQAQEAAVKKSGQIAQAISDASLYLAISLVLGVMIATAGGLLGVRDLRRDYETDYYTVDRSDESYKENFRNKKRL